MIVESDPLQTFKEHSLPKNKLKRGQVYWVLWGAYSPKNYLEEMQLQALNVRPRVTRIYFCEDVDLFKFAIGANELTFKHFLKAEEIVFFSYNEFIFEKETMAKRALDYFSNLRRPVCSVA